MNWKAAAAQLVKSFIVGFLTIAGADGVAGSISIDTAEKALIAGAFALLLTVQELLTPTSYIRPVEDGTLTAKAAAKPGA